MNSEHRTTNSKLGFTLVELLVVIGVLSIVGILVLNIFAQSLRGSNKAQILSSMKKNGESILQTMDKNIRDSDNLVCVGTSATTNDTIVVVNEGKYTRFRFIAPTSSANGKIQQDSPNPLPVPSNDPNYSQAYLCSEPLNQPLTLTDTNPQTGTSLYSGSFTKQTAKAGYKDIITIQFSLKPGVKAPSSVSGQIDDVAFATSIGLR